MNGREHAQEMPTIRMAGVDGQCFAIERLGLLKSAGAMARARLGEQVRNAGDRGPKRVKPCFAAARRCVRFIGFVRSRGAAREIGQPYVIELAWSLAARLGK